MNAVPFLAGTGMLLLGLLLPVARRHGAAARLVAAQGGLLALAAASAAWGGAGRHLWLLAVGALVGRALPVPVLLRLAAGRSRGATWPPSAPGAGGRFLLGGGLAVLAVAAVLPAGSGLEPATREGFAVALAALLTGLLAMLLSRGVASGLLGLLAAENGALLGLVHAGGAPGAAVLAVLSPGLVACVLFAAMRARGAGPLTLSRAPRR